MIHRRFLAVLLLSFAVDLALSGYVLALQYHLWAIVCATTVALPFGNYLFNAWFVDDASAKHRLALTAANALGGLLAQGIVIPLALWLGPSH